MIVGERAPVLHESWAAASVSAIRQRFGAVVRLGPEGGRGRLDHQRGGMDCGCLSRHPPGILDSWAVVHGWQVTHLGSIWWVQVR